MVEIDCTRVIAICINHCQRSESQKIEVLKIFGKEYDDLRLTDFVSNARGKKCEPLPLDSSFSIAPATMDLQAPNMDEIIDCLHGAPRNLNRTGELAGRFLLLPSCWPSCWPFSFFLIRFH